MSRKGLIVLGYPGIGKSSCGGTDGCVDLESSYFDHNESYCQVAESIADQGYTVFVSTHPNVVEYFSNKTWFLPNVSRAIIFCPQQSMKEEWIKRLRERWISTGTGKDLRALRRAEYFFTEDIDSLFKADLPVYQPEAIDYDLRHYICKMRNDWCETEAKTNDLQ